VEYTRLTKQQKDILMLLCKGLDGYEIAEKLNIERNNVDQITHRIRKTLNAKTLNQVIFLIVSSEEYKQW